VYSLRQVRQLLADESLLQQLSDGTFLLRSPLIIRPGATLVIRDSTLKMSAEGKAFIHNSGELYVYDSTVIGWSEEARQHASLSNSGNALPWLERSFIYGQGDSLSVLVASHFSHLGQPGFKFAQGLFFEAANDESDFEPLSVERFTRLTGRPRILLVGNEFVHCYRAVHMAQGKSAIVIGNLFKSSVVQHLTLSDVSEKVVLVRNVFNTATLGSGVLLNRLESANVQQNLFLRNHKHGLEMRNTWAESTVNGNQAIANGGSGLFFEKNTQVLLSDNQLLGNATHGVHVKSPGEIHFKRELFSENGFYGVQLENEFEAQQEEATKRHIGFLTAHLEEVTFDDNYDATLGLKGEVGLTLENANFKSVGGPRFKGQIAPFAGQLLQQLQDNQQYQRCFSSSGAC